MADPKYDLNDLMNEVHGMKKEVESMKSELENAKLRAENAELKLAVGKTTPSDKDYPPLRQGKNQSNDWLKEVVYFQVPYDQGTKEKYIDVIVNGRFYRMQTGKNVKMPRFVALLLQQRIDEEIHARDAADLKVFEFQQAQNAGFSKTINPPPRS